MSYSNPNHPVTKAVNNQWHKIAALIMLKFGVTELEITVEDVDRLAKGGMNIVFDARGTDYERPVTLRIVDDKTAAELLKQEGGSAADS